MMGGDLKRLIADAWARPPRALREGHERILFGLTLAVIGVALAVRLYGINYSLWDDEIASIAFASQPVGRLWSDWMIREPNPPLFYTVLHYWMPVFGQSDVAIKSLGTLFGIGNIVVVALIARRLGGSWLPALVTTLFVGLNPYHIFYSQQGRAFTLTAFAASVACLALVRIVTRHSEGSARGGARTDWALFGLAMLAALYSHTTMVVFYVTVNLMIAAWIAITAPRARLLISWVACNLVICAGFAWWVWITLQQLGPNENLAWMDTVYLGNAVYYTLEVFAPQPNNLPFGTAAVALVPLVCFAFMNRWGAAIMVLCGSALLFFYLGSKLTTIMQERTILHLYPLFAVGLGLAAADIRRRGAALVLVALPMILSIFTYREDFPYREFERWPQKVALAATDPTIPALVTNEAFALYFDHYCNQRFGTCPVRIIVLDTKDNSPWAIGLSDRATLSEREALSIRDPVVRTIDWDGVDKFFPETIACSATDRSPAYRAGDSAVLGQSNVTTWHRRRECFGK